MRTCLPVLLVALTIAAPTNAATRNFGITSFDRIRIDGPFTVKLATGVAPFAKATGSGPAIDRLSIEVRGTTLLVRNAIGSWGGYPGADPGTVEISLGTHDLGRAELYGSGSLAIDRVRAMSFSLAVQGSGVGSIGQLSVDQLAVSLAGTASARLTGDAAKTTSVVRGLSNLDAANLKAKDADIVIDGAGTIDAEVGDSVTITASGPATIRLSGKPACTIKASGSASVTGCNKPQ